MIQEQAIGIVTSMTGYGEATETLVRQDQSSCTIKVQCKSVNHRFVDISCKLPSRYAAYEIAVQKIVKSKIQRGKVEIFVSRDADGVEQGVQLRLDLVHAATAKMYKESILGVSQSSVQEALLQALFQRREVLEFGSATASEEDEKFLLEKVVSSALDNLCAARKEEGLALEKEVRRILVQIAASVHEIDTRSQNTADVIKTRFQERLQALYAHYSAEDQRLQQEIAILADKADIREEIVRLNAHIVSFEKALSEGGRKLEFIVQEMGREINTIGSKTTQIEISSHVIAVKSYLEKIREQLQNIE